MVRRIEPNIRKSLEKISETANRFPAQRSNLKKLNVFISKVGLPFIGNNYVFRHSTIGSHKGIALAYEERESQDYVSMEYVFEDEMDLPYIYVIESQMDLDEEVKLSPRIEKIPFSELIKEHSEQMDRLELLPFLASIEEFSIENKTYEKLVYRVENKVKEN